MDLKELRQSKGITQKKMADMLGMTITNYCNYERGLYPSMKQKLIDKISEVLGCEYFYKNKEQ